MNLSNRATFNQTRLFPVARSNTKRLAGSICIFLGSVEFYGLCFAGSVYRLPPIALFAMFTREFIVMRSR